MQQNNFHLPFRNIIRQKRYAVLNVIGLSIGLTCMLLAVLYWKEERSYDLFHKNTAQLFRITTTATDPATGKRAPSGGTRQIHGPTFKAAIPEFREMVRLLGGDIKGDVRHGDRALKLQLLFADDNFFEVFHFPLLYGDSKQALKDVHSAVISEETALRFFGTTNCLGKDLHLDADPSAEKLGGKPMIVTGVAKSLSPRSSIQFEILLPMRFMQASFQDEAWVGGYLGTFVLLANGADEQRVAQKMDDVFAAHAKVEIQQSGHDPQVAFGLQNIRDIHLNPFDGQENNWNECGVVNGSRPMYSNLFLGICFLIFLLASLNFISLSIAAALGRAKEVAIRKLNGSGRSHIFRQFLAEAALLCALAFTIALVLSVVCLPTLNALADKNITISEAFDWKLMACFGFVFLLNVSFAGLYPAWQLSAFMPVETLYNRSRPPRHSVIARILVVAQFALAFVLLVSTLVFYRQMDFVRHLNLGYEPGYIVRSAINGDREYAPIKQFLRNEIAKNACFQGISFGGEFGGEAEETTVNGNRKVAAVYQSIDADFLSTLRINLRQGLNFSAPDSRDVIVNEAFVREAALSQPLGAMVRLHRNYDESEKPYTIAGVVSDFHFKSLHNRVQPLIMFRHEHHNGDIWLRINQEKSSEALALFEKIYRQAMPGAVYEWHFLSDLNAREYAREQRWQHIVGLATGIALFICLLGLYGLAHLNTVQRTKEIGIRKVLGASVSSVTRLLTKDFLKLVLIAIFIASPVAYHLMQQWLSNFAYRIDIQWWMFAGAGVLALLTAYLSVAFQSVKAALANPVKALL